MLELLKPFLASGPFIPHGHCYLWQLDLVWLHLISDALIALAYYSIPVMLVYFVNKRQDLPFNWIFILFGIFIIACGTTHIMEIWTLWHPTYWLSGFIKAITAVASVYTAWMLLTLIPQALALPSPAQLAAANRALQEQIIERQRAEVALKQSHDELEIRVEERTAELKKANEQLRGEIVERQRVEKALRESEERLNAVLDNSTALIYVKNTQGQFILLNHWYEKLFHLNREEVKGKTDYDIFPKEMADIYRANDQRVLEAKAPLEWEEVVPQDNSLHTYLSIKFPLYDVAGVAYAVCGISTDITERKQAEEALLSSFATNRALLNAIPDLMFRISRDGTFVNFKAAKDNNLLVPSREFLGKKVYEVLPQEVAVPIIDCVERALQTDEIQIFEYQLAVNNQSRDYEARIVVSAKDEVMAIVRDITERKRAEEDIRNALEKQRELSELRSRLVTMTSHEFRTPLTTILSSTQLLEKYSNKMAEEKKLQHFYRIQTAVKHMTQMLNNVLLFGKADVGKVEFKPGPVDLVKFCRDLVEDLQVSTGNSHTIAFCSQVQCTTAYCIDETLLLCILSNLLSNATKYSPQGGTVHFDLIFHQGEAIFHVQDEGIGIPVADQAQLFNSFHRASNVGTISGTGLGLAIVKKSVDLHGGKITVNSEVGVGTTFTVTLPLKTQVQTDEKNSSD